MSTPNATTSLSKITAVVLLDATQCTTTAEYRAVVAELTAVPSGASVVLNVGDALPNYEAVSHLRDHRGRIGITVWGTNSSYVYEWMRALRDEIGGYPA